MQDIGANVIRVYHVDPTADHQGCMDAFAAAGIYLFVDLDDFPTQIQPVWLSERTKLLGIADPMVYRLRPPGTRLSYLPFPPCWTSSKSMITLRVSLSETRFSPLVGHRSSFENLHLHVASRNFRCSTVRQSRGQRHEGIPRFEELPEDSNWVLSRYNGPYLRCINY